jgi:hypothetical protein
MSKNAEQLAFAVRGHDLPNGDYMHGAPGLTKREYAAIKAMEGYCSRTYKQGEPPDDVVADWAVNQADALFKRLEKSCTI